MQLQSWSMFHPVMNFFDTYPKKEKIIQYFFDVIKDWYHVYGNDPSDITTSKMPQSYAWYDMSVGFRALVLSFFINRIHYFSIDISNSNKNILYQLARQHINNLKLEKVFSLNNHGIFQIQGLMALIHLIDIDKYQVEKRYALKQMENLIHSQYDDNGVHKEHSPDYHFYVLKSLENLLLNDWYQEKKVIKEMILNAKYIGKWLVDPYHRPACIGDSCLDKIENMNMINSTPYHKLEKTTHDKAYTYSNFNHSGYVIFRSNWNKKPQKSTYLFFMGMYQSKTHKHRDCLSFEWFDNGDKIICDSGKYGYFSDKYRRYYLSNKAHNSVEIEGFDILKMKPYQSSIQETHYKDNIFIINGKLNYRAIQFERTLHLKAQEWIVVIDDLNFQKARNITQWFHLEKKYTLSYIKHNYMVFKKDKNELIIHSLNEDMVSSIHNGDDEYMQGFISEKDSVISKSYAIGFHAHTKNKKLITILALNKSAYSNAVLYTNILTKDNQCS